MQNIGIAEHSSIFLHALVCFGGGSTCVCASLFWPSEQVIDSQVFAVAGALDMPPQNSKRPRSSCDEPRRRRDVGAQCQVAT
eukprot:5039567-Pleurochrysis_carterae.AAC.2